MKTLEQVIQAYENKQRETCFDGRDMHRLAKFVPEDSLKRIGVKLNDEYKGTHDNEIVEWTHENIVWQLKRDVKFGWEKATDQRGISAAMMHEVVMMWNWILEEGLEDDDEYGSYGIPLFRKTAEKYEIELT